MSDRRSETPAHDIYLYQNAQRVVRSILDDHASAAQISPSGELYRAIEQRYNPTQASPADATTAPRTRTRLTPGTPTNRSRRGPSNPSRVPIEPLGRSLRVPVFPNDFDAWLVPPSATSLPSLRSTNSPRYSPLMAETNSAGNRHSRNRMSDWATERRRAGRQPRDGVYDANIMTEPNRDARRPMRSSTRTRPRLATDDVLAEQSYGENLDIQGFLDEYSQTSRDVYDRDHVTNSSRQRPGELPESARRAKRRKIDSDRISSTFAGFRYGRYGQVDPGHLTMEIVSCDGGVLPDDGRRYAVENILKNDPTVYCTEGSRCNIVLRHQGATVFTLQELVIKAPRSNYTSPVQEGMVFVTMHSDHLLARTAQYQIQYADVRRPQNLPPVQSVRYNPDGTTMTNAQIRARRLYEIGRDEDQRIAQIPPEFRNITCPYGVKVEYGDEDADEEAASEWQSGMPHRRTNGVILGTSGSESSEEDEEDDDDDDDEEDDDDELNQYISRPDDRPRHRRQAHSLALAEAAEAAQVATQEAVRAVGGEMLAPSARFFIERNKSQCTITFDPPVCGRFILLKMWSPHQDPTGNIDIQAVVAKGFAGPRYFPAIEVR